MTTFVDKAFDHSFALQQQAFHSAMDLKQAGGLSSQLAVDSMAGMGDMRSQSQNRMRYGLYRGWLYSAINALGEAGSGQPVSVYKSKAKREETRQALHRLNQVKGNRFMLTKHEQDRLELIESDPLIDTLRHPNPIQGQMQFVYSFIVNFLLTGWSYIVAGEGENGLELYSLPTTWITPDHSKGPFSAFKFRNPNNRTQEPETLTREQVGFAHMPNPGNPLAAMAPAESQMLAIRIDDHIQSSQEQFFENGIFPSAAIIVGKQPHPHNQGGGGTRPILSARQKRQIYSAISKSWTSSSRYGLPVILDGLIEKIERFSATQNEMGWEKSEDKIKRRILSAFGLHSFILGENMPGSYAQAYIIDDRTCRKVNVYLHMLGQIVSNLAGNGEREVFWHPCTPDDPSTERQYWQMGLQFNMVEDSEFRSKLQLPPREPKEESKGLANTVGGAQLLTDIFTKINLGQLTHDQAVRDVAYLFGMSESDARELIGKDKADLPPTPKPGAFSNPPQNDGGGSGQSSDDENDDDDESDDKAIEELRQAVSLLKRLK